MTAKQPLRNAIHHTLRDVLTELEKEGAALGHFNVADLVLLKAMIGAAAEAKLPVFEGHVPVSYKDARTMQNDVIKLAPD